MTIRIDHSQWHQVTRSFALPNTVTSVEQNPLALNKTSSLESVTRAPLKALPFCADTRQRAFFVRRFQTNV